MVLNLNWEIIWVFVNLLILFLLMKKFLFGPITKLLDERGQRCRGHFGSGGDAAGGSGAAEGGVYPAAGKCPGRGGPYCGRSAETADLAYSRRMDEAAQDVQHLNEQAARQRAADREAMLASAQKQVADLVLLTTAKVSQRTLDADADRAMLDALLEEVGDE